MLAVQFLLHFTFSHSKAPALQLNCLDGNLQRLKLLFVVQHHRLHLGHHQLRLRAARLHRHLVLLVRRVLEHQVGFALHLDKRLPRVVSLLLFLGWQGGQEARELFADASSDHIILGTENIINYIKQNCAMRPGGIESYAPGQGGLRTCKEK